MSIHSIRRMLPLLMVVMAVSGCALPGPAAPPASPTPKATAAPTRNPRATRVPPTQTPTPDPQVNNSGITFTFDPSLGGVTAAELPPDDINDVGSEDWLLPDRMSFPVANYPLTKSDFQPQIAVFPIGVMADFNPGGLQTIQDVSALITDKTDPAKITGAIPQLAYPQEDELFHSQVKYLDFRNGSGIRFVAQYGSGLNAITNMDLVYVFQGVTSDGNYFVSVLMPLSQHDLPKTEDSQTNSQAAAMLDDYKKYLADTGKDLAIADDASFNPKLSVLDKIVGTFNVAPTVSFNVTPTDVGKATATPSGSETPGGTKTPPPSKTPQKSAGATPTQK